MVSDKALEAEFQMAIEFELRRSKIPFSSQQPVGAGRLDLVVGGFGVELKVDQSNTQERAPYEAIIAQASTYLKNLPSGIDTIAVAILSLPTHVVYFHQMRRPGGTQMVLRRNGVKPRKNEVSTALSLRDPQGLLPSGPLVVEGEVVESPLSHADYLALRDTMTNQRDLLLCMTLYATGLRINELLRVTVERLEKRGPVVFFYFQRSKKKGIPQYEPMPLPAALGVLLWDYVKGQGLKPGDRMFKLSDRRVRYIFWDAGKRAIGRPVHPHEFRGACARALQAAGVPFEVVAKYLGHTDTRTTLKYYLDLTDEKRLELARKVPI